MFALDFFHGCSDALINGPFLQLSFYFCTTVENIFQIIQLAIYSTGYILQPVIYSGEVDLGNVYSHHLLHLDFSASLENSLQLFSQMNWCNWNCSVFSINVEIFAKTKAHFAL